jgi:hypothetical protein
VIADRICELSTTTGTGCLTLGGPKQGYRSFAALGDNATFNYAIVSNDNTEWELGFGTYRDGELHRNRVYDSSSAGAHVNFSFGCKDVSVSMPVLPEVELNVVSEYIPARQRRLRVEWTREAEQDLRAVHHVDTTQELLNVFGRPYEELTIYRDGIMPPPRKIEKVAWQKEGF